ncbi:hypothetical protein LUZ60_014377 [Juncus effusus]|nr:hypothetical protein LUZ60_014377 [Juncus effusus]
MAIGDEMIDNPIPVVDLGLLNHHMNGSERSMVIQDIRRACQKHGCFQIVNHGISRSVMNGALEAASAFFELHPDEKTKFASNDVKRPVRYEDGLKGSENKPRLLLKHYANPLADWVHLWPPNPPYYREKMGAYAEELQRVSIQLINLILDSLGLGPDYMTEKLQKATQLMAVNYYPSNPSLSNNFKIGLSPHTDYGFITILLQTCNGLQISPSNSTAWQPIHIQPDALHVHLGDFLEVLSNGRYKSLMHQAVLGDEKRISIASIHGFSMDEMVKPLVQLVDEQHPKMYNESSFTKKYPSYTTLRSNLGTNHQIHTYNSITFFLTIQRMSYISSHFCQEDHFENNNSCKLDATNITKKSTQGN